MTYQEYNDSKGSEVRRLLAANKAERQRMLDTLQDRDMGCITLYMSKRDVQSACVEALTDHAMILVPELRFDRPMVRECARLHRLPKYR